MLALGLYPNASPQREVVNADGVCKFFVRMRVTGFTWEVAATLAALALGNSAIKEKV